VNMQSGVCSTCRAEMKLAIVDFLSRTASLSVARIRFPHLRAEDLLVCREKCCSVSEEQVRELSINNLASRLGVHILTRSMACEVLNTLPEMLEMFERIGLLSPLPGAAVHSYAVADLERIGLTIKASHVEG